jgi:hypothetical protein
VTRWDDEAAGSDVVPVVGQVQGVDVHHPGVHRGGGEQLHHARGRIDRGHGAAARYQGGGDRATAAADVKHPRTGRRVEQLGQPRRERGE